SVSAIRVWIAEVVKAVDLDGDPVLARQQIDLGGGRAEAHGQVAVELEPANGCRCRLQRFEQGGLGRAAGVEQLHAAARRLRFRGALWLGRSGKRGYADRNGRRG